MPKIIIATSSGRGATTINVSGPHDAVRKVSASLRKIMSDQATLVNLQSWANSGFKKPLDLRVNNGVITITYYE